jgi:hypothetical protein
LSVIHPYPTTHTICENNVIILFLGFFILVVVTSSLSVAATYMQLSQEDHRWWWRSVAGGAAGGGFVFLHGFMFLWMNSQMSGFLQLSFFFGYSAVLAFAFALMLGETLCV